MAAMRRQRSDDAEDRLTEALAGDKKLESLVRPLKIEDAFAVKRFQKRRSQRAPSLAERESLKSAFDLSAAKNMAATIVAMPQVVILQKRKVSNPLRAKSMIDDLVGPALGMPRYVH